jgi:hypothetical protein
VAGRHHSNRPSGLVKNPWRLGQHSAPEFDVAVSNFGLALITMEELPEKYSSGSFSLFLIMYRMSPLDRPFNDPILTFLLRHSFHFIAPPNTAHFFITCAVSAILLSPGLSKQIKPPTFHI